ncbi:MAG: Asp-tRNA(Asn)/Glu-tRNA(Gln) amidotransferase GatCAB subunit B, partial [Peptococcaceae bacterium]|nr:Asp-tRNA(Asn)/Glu-tRNA(Gln) amidotransferase GatCAB subunit B [Peptococcaceae bacterium]
RTLLRYAKVAECEMAHGTMRCDVNLSVRPAGSDVLGVRTEMKNMNSIEAIKRAIEFETARHIDAIENGTEVLVQETRRWDDAKGRSYAMRSKETAGDYRYFPDPNVMPVVIDDAWFDSIKASVPEFPEVKREKYIAMGLTEYDAERISESIMLCECFEEASAACGNPKEVVNWITSDVMRILNAKQMTYEMLNLDNKAFGKLISLTVDGKISRANSKKILSAMFDDPTIEPESYAEANDMLIGEQNDDMIIGIVRNVIANDPKSVNDFKSGKEKALMALFGKCMKELKGNCDPQQLRKVLLDCINE